MELHFEKENHISRWRVILVFYLSNPYANEFATDSPNKKPFTFQSEGFSFIRDLDRIQTCNLLSRNQVRYSVAPRGLID